jgi:phage shock protein A
MSVLTRFVDIVNANLNAALDKAEKPEHTLRLIVQEMEEALVEVRSHAAGFIAEKKQVERKIETLQSQAKEWVCKAELALSKGREDLARQALVVKGESEREAAELNEHLGSINEALSKLSADADQLQTKLDEAKQKQSVIAKRERVAVVQLNSRKTLDKNKLESASRKYEALQQKVEALESQVEAYDLTSNPSLAESFRQLEADAKLEDELAALKKKVVNG